MKTLIMALSAIITTLISDTISEIIDDVDKYSDECYSR